MKENKRGNHGKIDCNKNVYSKLEQKIVNSIRGTEYENVESTVKVTVVDDNNMHILVFIEPYTGDSLIFFLGVLGEFVMENRNINDVFPIFYEVLRKNDENLASETVSYLYS